MTETSGYEVTQRQGAWIVRMWWPHGPVSGGPQRIAIEAAADAPAPEVARGITTTVLRRVDLPGAVALAEEESPGQDAAHEVGAKMQELGSTARALLDREGISGAYLAALAAAYAYAAANGVSGPTQWLAKAINRNPANTRVHLSRARKEGYLNGPSSRDRG
ncbi:hypothetical protein [Streptomyces buecherae]|uniref:hypothetical protein n=1 Tax=Streptomyces buecherae TaxID=2763006 RepID=UPI00379DBF0F